jgi:hypothetical protein
MANQIWRGDAPAAAQLNTVTPANVLVGNVFTLTINGKSISFTATAATVANVTAGLAALVAASTIPELLELTATDATTALTLTANTAGVPFTQTSSATGGTATLTTAVTAASSGPNDWSTAANWSAGSVPVTGDAVYLTRSSADVLYGLAQSAVTLASLAIDSTYTGNVGLPRVNANGYYEYRATYLAVGVTALTVGGGSGSGSGRIKLDLGSVQTTANVQTTGSPAENGLPAVILKGTHASNALNVLQGSVGVAVEPGDVSTVATVQIGYQNSQTTDVVLTLGAGCTLTTIKQNGGTITVQSAVTTWTVTGGGSGTVLGTGAVTTLDIENGAVNYQGTGTITTATVGPSGSLTFSQDPRSRTITNLTLYAGCTYQDGAKTVTWTNPAALKAPLSSMALDLGAAFFLARS